MCRSKSKASRPPGPQFIPEPGAASKGLARGCLGSGLRRPERLGQIRNDVPHILDPNRHRDGERRWGSTTHGNLRPRRARLRSCGPVVQAQPGWALDGRHLVLRQQGTEFTEKRVDSGHATMRVSDSAEDAAIFVLAAQRIGPNVFLAEQERVGRADGDVSESQLARPALQVELPTAVPPVLAERPTANRR